MVSEEARGVMSIERTYYCDNPTCTEDTPGSGETTRHVTTASPPPYLPDPFIETRQRTDNGDLLHHFCSWDCVMKFAAQKPATEIIPWEGP